MNLSVFHFIRPAGLWALVVWLIVLGCWLKHKRQQAHWLNVCDAELLPYILQRKPVLQSRLPLFASCLASLLAIFAFAGPTWQRVPVPAFRNDAGLVIALDLSRSMNAADIKPSRLVRARYKIADILKQRKDGQTALIVYAGDAFVVTPLTHDNATIASQLEALSPEMMPNVGSRALFAVQKAVELFKQAGLQTGQILLVTDEVKKEEHEEIIKTLSGYQLAVLGVGTEQGAPITLPEGGFLKDALGNIITAKLPRADLQQLASAGGGVYQTISDTDSDLKNVLAAVDKSVQDTVDKQQRDLQVAQWEEKGVYLIWLIVPLAALQFRRGLWGVTFLLLLPIPQNSYALNWQDIWHTPDQQAQQAFNRKNYQQAAEKFENPDWKAAAYYKAKQYENALTALKNPQTADAYYNQGNALARSGKLEQALAAYREALKLKPQDADTLYNKKQVEEALKKQSPPKQNSQNQAQNQPKSGSEQPNKARDTADKKSQNSAADKPTNPDKPTQSAQQDKMQSQSAQDKAARQAQQMKAQQDETQQANAQWLKRIPDDPAGLLRRKFKYQYSQQPNRASDDAQTW